MSTHNDKHDPNNLLPEDSGVTVKPIALFLIILSLATALVFVVIKGMTYLFDRVDEANAPVPASRTADGSRPAQREPLLQGAPEKDAQGNIKASQLPLAEMRDYRRKTEEATKAYGWVKENAEAHIPIERAKELLLERGGLPVKADTAIAELQAAEKAREQIFNADASGGRLIGK